MRVVFLIGQLGLGGGERQLFLLLRGLDKRKVTPQVVCFNANDDYWGPRIRELGISVTYLSTRGVVLRLVSLLKILHATRPTIGISWDIQTNPYILILSFFYSFHRVFGGVRCNLFRPGRSAFQRWVSTVGLNHFIVNSSQGIRHVKLLRTRAKVELMYNGFELFAVPPDAREVLRAMSNITDEWPIVLFVGGLKQVKNPTLMLEAFLDSSDVVKAHLVFIGDGKLSNTLRMMASKHTQGSRVHFLGVQPNAYQLMGGGDLLVLTSITEGMPGVLLEAAAAGLPLISTKVGGATDIIEEGVNGYLVPVNSKPDLQRRLVEMLSNPVARKEMGIRSKKRADELFNVDVMVKTFERIIGLS